MNNNMESRAGGLAHMNVTLDMTTPVTCPCGGNVFSEGMMFRRVSALLTGRGKEGLMPIPVYFCNKCCEPLDEMLPDELKKVKLAKT